MNRGRPRWAALAGDEWQRPVVTLAALVLALGACDGAADGARGTPVNDVPIGAAAGGAPDGGAQAALAPGRAPIEVRRAWPVMGTLLEIAAWHADSTTALEAVRAARAAVVAVDSLMSNYRADSELSRINRRAGTGQWTPVSLWTARVLEAALEWGERSGGSFDVTVGPVVDVWGFYRERGRVPDPARLDSAASLVGHPGLDYESRGPRARLRRPGMRIDLGAIAKGFAVDRALDDLRAAGVDAAMVDLGGNVRVLGSPPGPDGWSVGIRDPRRTNRLAAVARLAPGSATATSGDYERFFEVDGVRYAHIIDPRTARPARGVAAVTVVAPGAMDADALSTTLYLLGPDRGACLLEGRDGVAALWFLDDAGRAGNAAPRPLETRVAGAAAGVFVRPVESPGESGVGKAERPARTFGRARCNTEG